MFETSPTPHKFCDGSSGRQGHKQITQIKLDLLQVWHSLGLVHWWLWVTAESGMLFRNTPFTPCIHIYEYTEHLDIAILYHSISFYKREREKKKSKREKNTSGVRILHKHIKGYQRHVYLPPSIKWSCFNPFMPAIAWGHMSAPRDADA